MTDSGRGRPVDLVVGGPPKSGTSSLFDALDRHPGTCASHAKEPVFFSTDAGLDGGRADGAARSGTFARGPGWYDDLFRCPDPGAVRIEGTTDYLPSASAPALLARHAPGVHLAFCLREPAARLVSHYWHEQRFTALDDLAVLVERALGGDVHPRLRYWLHCSSYGHHLTRWLEHHDAERLHLVGFDAVREDVDAAAAPVLRAVGLEPVDHAGPVDSAHAAGPADAARTANAAGTARSRRLHRLLTVSRARRVAEELPDWLQRPARDLARWLMDRNLERAAYPPPDPAVLTWVRTTLADDRARLDDLLATHWPQHPSLRAEVARWPST